MNARRLPDAAAPDCTFSFEGEPLGAVAGEPIAVALLASGTRVLSRSIKYHRPRSFFCLAGHCGACLMRVGGVPNVKACRAPVAEGLSVERQNAFPSGGFDVLGAVDFFFPKGMDHHTLLTSSRALNAVMRKVVREIGGLGRLPDEEPAARSIERARPAETARVDVAVIGGGPAGLAAATECARAGRSVLLVDEGDRAGGSLLAHPAHGPAAADRLAGEARAAGVEVRTGAAAIGYYPEDEGGLLAVDDHGSLVRLHAARFVYATGGYDTNALFVDNDRPGICAARAVGALLVRHRVLAGRRPVVLGDGPYARALAAALAEAGADVTRIGGASERVVGARGHAWVSGLDLERADGTRRRIPCDLVAVAGSPPAPASELPRQHGARVELRPEAGGFACAVDEQGRTTVEHVYATGDVCGYRGPEAALAHGALVGRAVASSF